jgi:hypothetical protein
MKRVLYKIFVVITTIGIYYVIGLNAVKLLLLLVPDILGLPQSIRTNSIVIIIVAGILAPVIAAGLAYRLLAKYLNPTKIKLVDKKLGEEIEKIMKITLIISTSIASLITILSVSSSNK